MGCPRARIVGGLTLFGHSHGGTDPWDPQRARRVALARSVVGQDHIARSKTARGAIADPDFHLPRENKNVLAPGRRVPIAKIVRGETAEHEVGTRLNRDVVDLLGRQREIFKEGDLQNVSDRRCPYISERSCACSFTQRDYGARKGVRRTIGIL